MKLGFYSFDNAGGDAMKILSETAQAMGHEAVLFPKQVRDLAKERGQELMDLDVMITGLSSFETEQELEFADFCLKFQTPWFVFEDVPEACLRPKAKDWAPRARLVFLAHPSGFEAAKEFGYDGTVYLGPPPQWLAEYEGVMAAKTNNTISTEAIKRKGAEAVYSFDEDDNFVGIILGKDPDENNRILCLLRDALLELGDKYILAISQHPGEKPDLKKTGDEQRFEEAFAERRRILDKVWSFNSGWKGAKLAGNVDVLVSGSGSNITIASAYARVPQVWIDDEGVRARMKAQSGKETWFVPALGGALVSNGHDLEEAITTALSAAGRTYLLNKQEQNFPLPEDWHTEKKIVNFLEKVV